MAYNVIVADPSYAVQKTVQMVLQEPEFKVHAFEDGQEMLDALADIRPAAVLLGVSLSGRDGYEVARSFRSSAEFRQVPLFFLRGTYEPFDMEKISGIDIEAIIQKPFDSEKLAVKIKDLIENKMSPATLPEEPFLAETGAAGFPEDLREPESGRPDPGSGDRAAQEVPAPSAEPAVETPGRLSPQEIVDMEREIEKRVKARVLSEVKGWLDEEMANIKSRS
ncbi:MAG: response regulator [Acidobacteriota bacterium]|nr:response regulator [Acidobacteriota bacterium]